MKKSNSDERLRLEGRKENSKVNHKVRKMNINRKRWGRRAAAVATASLALLLAAALLLPLVQNGAGFEAGSENLSEVPEKTDILPELSEIEKEMNGLNRKGPDIQLTEQTSASAETAPSTAEYEFYLTKPGIPAASAPEAASAQPAETEAEKTQKPAPTPVPTTAKPTTAKPTAAQTTPAPTTAEPTTVPSTEAATVLPSSAETLKETASAAESETAAKTEAESEASETAKETAAETAVQTSAEAVTEEAAETAAEKAAEKAAEAATETQATEAATEATAEATSAPTTAEATEAPTTAEATEAPTTAAATEPPAPKPVISYTEQEFEMLCHLVASEAYPYWSYEGQLMIAQTVVNRVRSGLWGNSLTSVIYAPGQFNPAEGSRMWRHYANDVQRQAVYDALHGTTILPLNSYFFCTNYAYNRSSWFQSLPVTAIFDNTYFMARK